MRVFFSQPTFSVQRTRCWSISSSWLSALPTAHVDVAVCHSGDTPRTQWVPGKDRQTDRQKSCISQNVGVPALATPSEFLPPWPYRLINWLTAFAWNLQIFDSRLIIFSPSFSFYPKHVTCKTCSSDPSELKLTTSCHSFSGYHN